MGQNTIQIGPAQKDADSFSSVEHLSYGSVLLLALGATYFPTIQWMYERYVAPDSYYSHGFIIPLISIFFIWKNKAVLRHPETGSGWIGAVLIVIAVFIHILGMVLYIFSLSGFSLFLYIIGSVWFLLGRRVFMKLLFPLAFLIFMFPVPEDFLTSISLPLKMLVAKFAVFIVGLTGLPVLQEGFQITIPAGQLLVGNPCSGLRSIIAFLAIASMLAHLRRFRIAKSALLLISAIPIAMAANVLRVLFLIFISQFWGLKAAQPESFMHTASGIGLFVVGLFLLFLTGNLLYAKEDKK
jgi:exosortase A